MTIHWKAVDQYFIVVLFLNPLIPRVKPWVIQSFPTFDSINRALKCDHSFGKLLSFTQFAILEFFFHFGLGNVKSERANYNILWQNGVTMLLSKTVASPDNMAQQTPENPGCDLQASSEPGFVFLKFVNEHKFLHHQINFNQMTSRIYLQ